MPVEVPEDLGRGMPAGVARVIRACLQKEPDARPTAEQLVEQLADQALPPTLRADIVVTLFHMCRQTRTVHRVADLLMTVCHDLYMGDAAKHMQASMGHGMHEEANAVLLEPGKTAEIVWTFPKDGEIEIACNAPGHYDGGMVIEEVFKGTH